MTKRLPTPSPIQRWRLPPIQEESPGWGLADIVMATTLLSTLWSVVNVPLLPFSPIVIMPFLFFLVGLRDWRKWRSSFFEIPEVKVLLLLYAMNMVGGFLLDGVSYATVSESGRIVAAAFLLVALSMYVLSNVRRIQRVLAVMLVALTVSVIWFLLEITVAQPFISLRFGFYADIYASQRSEIVYATRSGLVPFNHMVGYQLAGLIPMAFVVLLDTRPSWTKVLCMVAIVAGMVATYFVSQRSAFLAILIAMVLVLTFTKHRKLIVLSVPTIALLLIASAGLVVGGEWITDNLQVPLTEKLQSGAGSDDAIFRMRLQGRAVELIVQNPFGLRYAGIDWETTGFWPTYIETQGPWMHGSVSVHNGYLGYALNYGILYLLATGLFLYLVFRTAWRVARFFVSTPGMSWLAAGISATAIGLYFPQAFAHNASILTREPVSLVLLALLCALEAKRRRTLADNRVFEEKGSIGATGQVRLLWR